MEKKGLLAVVVMNKSCINESVDRIFSMMKWLKKSKDIIVGTRIAGGVINRRAVICIANGVVKANQPNLLKEFGGTVELTDRWARHLLLKTGWKERKGTTGKVAPPALPLEEEKFSFQWDIAQAVHDHNIPKRLLLLLSIYLPLVYT